MQQFGRRDFLRLSATCVTAGTTVPIASRALGNEQRSCTFGFGTYGMQSLTAEKAISTLAQIGYDSVELTAREGWDTDPGAVSPARRQALRRLLAQAGLKLPSLMEHLQPSSDAKQHAQVLDRLKGAAELGHDLSPAAPPLVQTTLGGGKWDEQKTMFRDRLGDWAAVGAATKTIIAIKPHRGGGMSRPAEAVWLIRQLGDTPWLRMVYDYSHYAFREMPLEETVQTALPYTAHVAIKDAVQTEKRVAFVLPGQSGTFDYARLFRLFYEGGYRGDFCCEVSGMVWNKKGYDPIEAARACYKRLAPAFKRAGVARG